MMGAKASARRYRSASITLLSPNSSFRTFGFRSFPHPQDGVFPTTRTWKFLLLVACSSVTLRRAVATMSGDLVRELSLGASPLLTKEARGSALCEAARVSIWADAPSIRHRSWSAELHLAHLREAERAADTFCNVCARIHDPQDDSEPPPFIRTLDLAHPLLPSRHPQLWDVMDQGNHGSRPESW